MSDPDSLIGLMCFHQKSLYDMMMSSDDDDYAADDYYYDDVVCCVWCVCVCGRICMSGNCL